MGYEVTSLLCNLGSASVKELCYFTGASHQTVKSLEKRGILRLQEREVFRHQLPDIRQTQPLSPLNEAQQAAYEGLRALMNGGKPEAALLYGVTGSGKTQVYLHLIEQTLAAGRGAIVMVPEIALTPSLLQLFLTHFGRQVAVLAQLPVHRGAVRRVEAGPGWTGLCGHWDPFCGVCSPGGCGPYDFG